MVVGEFLKQRQILLLLEGDELADAFADVLADKKQLASDVIAVAFACLLGKAEQWQQTLPWKEL